MAASVVCDSFLAEVLQGIHTVNDTYKLALFVKDATPYRLCRTTTVYTTTINGAAEVTGTNYAAGGVTLSPGGSGTVEGSGASMRLVASSGTPPTGGYAGLDFADGVFTNVTLSGLRANGFYALIYNSSKLNGGNPRAVAVCEYAVNDLSADPSAANLTITLPGTGTVAVKIAS